MQKNEMSPLALAYLGDAVFELCVRRYITETYNSNVSKMNEYARELVNAASQAAMYRKLEEVLTEEETAVIKRGRNAKSKSVPKKAAVSAYRYATGLEALFGYLYICGRQGRIDELFEICVASCANGENK
ncbi:MAG: ribonuclease III [Clostridiales bacterium]|jgi:ribonuclease-3 family protein|nr:ribonuclease III [Clostridiales bacterium]